MKKKAIKALWKQCFNDSDDFIDLYFDLRYNNEVNIDLESGKDIIAAMQLLPYPMTFCGEIIQTSYVSGACTHPDYRSKGAMRELLSQALLRMLRTKNLISTLIPGEPWLFNYYARMGYAPVFRYSRKEIGTASASNAIDIRVRSTVEYEEEVYLYLNRKMEERPCCLQHTVADFKVIIAELVRTKNAIYIATQNEAIAGVAITNQQQHTLEVQELLTDSKEIADELLYQMGQLTKSEHITVISPPTKEIETIILGMARIIDAKSVLQLYAAAYPEEELSIELTDEQISANNGYYYLCNGKCMCSQERLPETHIRLN
nr:GNAT family N-acetyltransferase [Bacteroides sp.]